MSIRQRGAVSRQGVKMMSHQGTILGRVCWCFALMSPLESGKIGSHDGMARAWHAKCSSDGRHTVTCSLKLRDLKISLSRLSLFSTSL